MERNAHYLIVGGFVAAVLATATIMLVWMAGSYDTNIYKRYSVYFEGSVSGLSEGSTVSYRGVNVGRVVSIRFDPDHPERITTIIEVEETTPISTSSSVSLQSVGITGLSALAIKTAAAGGEALVSLKGEKYPVIPSERSSLGQLLDDAPQITDSAIEVLARVNALLSEENIESIGKTLSHIEGASANLNVVLNEGNIETIGKTLSNVEGASANLNTVFNADNAKNISSMLKNLNRTTQRLDRLLSKNEKQIEGFTGDNLDEIAVLVKDTQEMVNAFKILAQKLGDDPSQILYKPNYQGVKVQQ